ncbi:phosphoenolpyruvate--protein phosphotransferase [Entomospira culicis]|uniref:phosphoenolpyruvate--protein phosphotransferase n=1 Tax=Entomospira culicis TaxID=2719989 RepID=A0A968GHK2_9SPIO|nr:phosphoenolpyruvate--protein phosphotransferase [Entomospira culicis]NIZ18559.1 phosphoenolpyruvate--protein phosphotransferase [Entomospira culicis]NIZ68775.1 phosphoenolpyruvate--protein phosphotransferase [Entomospira culicis]WDI37371.1 phosphoenolpyruvate--protein phosphotransferase [Entomospira culicis]WDI39000.1 phosphoenolpyruvate--protein phosphotransferase [Entomospira culicis]
MIFLAPATGKVLPIKDAPDPVFANKMLGDGIIIVPDGKKGEVCSPISGTIKTLNPSLHAFTIEDFQTGLEVLVHIGVDTVSLQGKGFKTKRIKEGSVVKAGQPLIVVNYDLIRSRQLSDYIMIIVINRPKAVVKDLSNGSVKAESPLFSIEESAALAQQESATSDAPLVTSDWIVVKNPTGLHARPTARLVNLAQQVTGSVVIEHEKGKSADGKSTTAIMGLGVASGDKIRIQAPSEADFKPMIDAINAGLGEDISGFGGASKTNTAPAHKEEPALVKQDFDTSQQAIKTSGESKLSLHIASPGLAIGNAFILKHEDLGLEPNIIGSVEEEVQFLRNALKKSEANIQAEMAEADSEGKEILEAHLAFLTDPSFVDETEELIATGKNAAWSWHQITEKNAKELAASENEYLAARAADVKDVARRVLTLILGDDEQVVYPENAIVLTEEFFPSDIGRMTANVIGTTTILGTPTGHAAIMMRNRGIPSLYGAPKSLTSIKNGTTIIIDAQKGELIVDPSPETLNRYKDEATKSAQIREQNLANAHQPATTTDRHTVQISGNISDVSEAKIAIERGAEGFGLVRSEFLFHDRAKAPSEEEQIAIYQPILDVTGEGHHAVVRLLDAGGDKPISYVRAAPEENPLLGIRGVRLFIDNEDLLRTQLRALLKCKPYNKLHIMIPMIAVMKEVDMVREIMHDEAKKLGINTNDLPKLGIMAETPAVCAMSEQFARHVDFFSVGSNDLTQYTMAMDRTHSRLASEASAANPAVLHQIRLLCEGAKKHNTHVAVCGGAASDPITAAVFIGLGVDELACSGVSVPQIKALMRKHSLKELQAVAQKALACETEEEVKHVVTQALQL